MTAFSNTQVLDATEASQGAKGNEDVHHYRASSPFTIRIESDIDSRAMGTTWLYCPHPHPSLKDPALPATTRSSSLSLSSKEGYPILRPQSDEYSRIDIRIGDVGILRSDRSFDFLFNICFPKDHPLNVGGGFEPVKFNQTTNVSKVDERDSHVASPMGYISKQTSANNVGFKHWEDNSGGMIQILPDGSTGVNLKNKKVFRQCAISNAHRWFTHAENVRGHSGSLYLITGSSQAPTDLASHPSTKSAMPSTNTLALPTQCVFFRGFKINRQQCSKGKEPANQILGPVLENDPFIHVENSASYSTSIVGTSSQSKLLFMSAYDIGPEYVSDIQRNEAKELYHPCDTINNFMLELFFATSSSVGSGPCFAVSHDDDWRSVWDEDKIKLRSEQELIRRICSSSTFIINGGTIYLEPLDDAIPRNSSSFPEKITARVHVLLTCPVHKCGEQFQQQSSLITHMQQKHNVVHGTAARVPLSAAAASSVTSKVSSQPKKKPRGGVPALSCAECRRLKVKCSRTFPCTGCIKKGCPAICPDGQLTTRKGNRFVVADVNELQAKISELTNRAKQLEDALAKSHSIVSPQIHPLLSDDLLQVKQSMKANSTAPSVSTDSTTLRVKSEVEKEEDKDEALIVYNATLGSLRIKKRNIFYGRSSSSWHFLLNEGRTGQQEKLQKKQFLPNDLPWLVHSFPFSAPVDISTRQKLIGFLPGISVARRYYQNYYRYGAWHYSPISEIEFRTTIFQPWYEPVNNLYDDPLGAHRLSVLFIILALGCLLDLEGQFPSPEAKRYYQLSKASIALMSVLDSPSLSTIQALLLILYYMLLDNIHDSRYAIMGLVTKLTHAAGLHLDGTHWNLAPEETYRRRHLFWEVYSYDMLLSLTFGRPANISVYHIESKMPLETTIDANGNVEMTYTAWKHKFIGECLGVIWDKAFGAHPLSYDLLKHLDQQMRAYYIPPSLRLPGFGGVNPDQDVHPPDPELTLTRHFTVSLKELISFHMHRGFFATAMNENPENPIEHRYGESVQTIYNSACIILALLRSLYKHEPQILVRFSHFFDSSLTCAYVLGAIASKPKVHLALSAHMNLELAYDLFDAALYEAQRRIKILAELNKLLDQARLALNITQSLLDDAQKLARPKYARTEDSNHNPNPSHPQEWQNPPEWPADVPSHHYHSTTAGQSSTLNLPRTEQYPGEQHSLYTPYQTQLLTQQFSDSFFEHPQMVYNPISGYQYHDYQGAEYFQQQMESGYDASGEDVMPMLEDSWQTFMNHIRQ